MSEITNTQITKSEEYKALKHFGDYIAQTVQTLHIPPNRMNHLKNVSDDINEILNVFVYAEHIGYTQPYAESFLERYDIYNQMIKEIHDETILKFKGESLDLWTSDYTTRYNKENSVKLNKTIKFFKNGTFKSKIKDYMKLLENERV